MTWPAYEEITLALGGNTVRLRPSLRAASHFARQDYFGDLQQRVASFHLGTIRDLITVAAIDRQEADAFLAQIDQIPLKTVSAAVVVPILALVAGFVPATTEDTKSSQGNSNPVPWPKFYKELYRTATGWLGWTPEAAWQATPTEINEAFAGHIAQLKAIHGAPEKDANQKPNTYSKEQLQKVEELGLDPEFDREGLQKLKESLTGRKR